ERDALVPGRERTLCIRFRKGQAGDPERVGDPVRIAELSGSRDRLLREGEGLVDASARLEAVDVGREAVSPLLPVAIRHRAGELHVAVEGAAVDLAEGLDKRGVPGLAPVIAGVDL